MERPSLDVRAFGIVISIATGNMNRGEAFPSAPEAWQASGILGRNTYEEQSDCGMIKTLSNAKSGFVPQPILRKVQHGARRKEKRR
jgi:hypothetical protein